ncbi:MAG TPA: hypothetical protein VJ870_04630 [Amycolatopsis sp.]|nr:hypothetical protein [Amycolatopsis sp.]
MSTPDRKPTDTTVHIGHTEEEAAELEMRRACDAAIYAHATNPTRTTTVMSWFGWHASEIGGITVPALLGAGVWDGFYAVSAVVALGWAANELRTRRGQAKRRATRENSAPQGKPDAEVSDEDGKAGA